MADHALLEAAEKAGKEVLEQIRLSLVDEWDLLAPVVKDDIAMAAYRVGVLTLREYRGEDVTQEMALLHSIVSDFKTGGKIQSVILAKKVEDSFWKGVSKVAESLGTFLRIFGQGALKGLLGGVV